MLPKQRVAGSNPVPRSDAAEDEAARGGDAAAFAALAERYRRQLHVHCYRMLGSVDDAEDLVQATFLRAWRGRAAFEGRALFRTWLYRIATNACLNALERAPRRIMPQDVVPPVTATSDTSGARAEPPWSPEIPWLTPYPDHLLEPAAPRESEPDAALVTRETIELVYLAAIQRLPPRQRAILILRDALDWSAKETATLLDTSLQSVNSALQRARATMRTRLPSGRSDWSPAAAATDDERSLLEHYMGALATGHDLSATTERTRAQIQPLAQQAPRFTSSMNRDLNAGKRIELEWLTGRLVRLANQHGVPVPQHTLLYTVIKARLAERDQTSPPAKKQGCSG